MVGRGGHSSGNKRISELDRQRALADIELFAAQGIIRGDEERKIRERKVRIALTKDQLDAALVDLRGDTRRRPKKGDLRVSADDRRDAVRRLEAYAARGYLDAAAAATRTRLVEASSTFNDIAAVFTDLPSLDTKAPTTERRISSADRADAVERLSAAMLDYRITTEECVAAKDQIEKARTREEIDAAFHGLTDSKRAMAMNQAAQAAKQAATVTVRAVKAGGRRVVSTILRAAIALVLMVIGIVAAIAGSGIVAAICLAGAACAAIGAVWALVGSNGRGRRT